MGFEGTEGGVGIIYEDRWLLVCHKEAGVATQTRKPGEKDMESMLKNYLKSPELYVLHRLDQPVEGLLLFAKAKEAAGRQERMEKRYYALALPEWRESEDRGKNAWLDGAEHTLTDYLVKDGRTNTSRVAAEGTKDAKRAELVLRAAAPHTPYEADAAKPALFEIALRTGRHHQIRVQMAHAGMPLLGDRKYGTPESLRVSREMEIKNVALCAYALSFFHPVTGKRMEFTIRPKNRAFHPFLPFNPLEKD